MDKKKLIMIGGGLILLLSIVLIISLISPKGQPSNQQTGVIASVVVAKGEDKTKNPVGITDLFSVNDPEIHAIVTYSNLPAGQVITYQWVDIKNNKTLKEETRGTQEAFSGLSSSSMIRDDRFTWGTGDFEFRILLNSKLVTKKSFSVQTDLDIQQGKILSSIKNIVLTTAVDLQGNPSRNTSSIFSKDDPDIFASVSYDGMPVKSDFVGKWFYVDSSKLIKSYQKSIVGTGVFSFGMNAKTDSWVPIKKWPLGKYELQIFLNGDQIKTIPFTVQ